MALAVLDGLRACHSSQPRVYHRDVKPGNIIVSRDGSVHLVDFGIALIAGKVTLTDARRIVGTPQFLAPEMLDGELAGPGTDLWALGVTLYYALTGHAPFAADNIGAIFAAIKFRNPPEPRDGGPLANLVLQMLRKRPEDRPDAATVAAVLSGVTSQPDPVGRPVVLDRAAARPGVAGQRLGGARAADPAAAQRLAHPEAPALRPGRPAGAQPGAGRRRHADRRGG